MKPGTVTFDGETAAIAYERVLPYTPEQVWTAITDPAHLAQWFAHKVVVEPRVGGRVEMTSGPSAFHSTGAVLAWDPPRVFEYEWKVAARPELPKGEDSVVRWELSPVAEGTRLRFEQRRLTRGTALGFAPGMHAYLDCLAAHLDGTPIPDWQQRYGEVASQYPSWQR
jgi:uncharacterized protein YndB with AHSA1/START domain